MRARLPSVALGIDRGVRLAAVRDVEERLELLDNVANGTSLHSFRERSHGVVGDDFTGLDEAGHEGLQGVRVRLAGDGSKSEDGLELHIGGVCVSRVKSVVFR